MSPYPPHSDLESWISPAYWESYLSGNLNAEYQSSSPFPHFVLTDFFRPEVFQQLRLDCNQEQTESLDGGNYPREQGYLRHPDLLRLIYALQLRDFFGILTGKALERPKGTDLEATAMAQVLRNIGKTGDRHVHTDEDSGLDLGVFIHLTDGW